MTPRMDRAVDAARERQGLVSADNDQQNAETLEDLPGSIGLVALGQIATEDRSLKVLSLDGVRPEARLAGDESYEFVKDLYIVLPPDPGPLARKFADFVQAPDRRAILESVDHATFG